MKYVNLGFRICLISLVVILVFKFAPVGQYFIDTKKFTSKLPVCALCDGFTSSARFQFERKMIINNDYEIGLEDTSKV